MFLVFLILENNSQPDSCLVSLLCIYRGVTGRLNETLVKVSKLSSLVCHSGLNQAFLNMLLHLKLGLFYVK